MGKILKDYEFAQGAVGGKKHPWDEWLDGRIHQLTSEDFQGTKALYIAHQARNMAKRRGIKIRISLRKDEDMVILQAYDLENATNGATQPPAPKKEKKAKKPQDS